MVSLPDHLLATPVGRRPLSREVMAQHQRDRVLAAAAEVIAKRGYNATTVDHIVAAAKIGVGSFYELFDNKEDCFLQAYEQIVAEAHEQIAAAIVPDQLWPEQICAALEALLEQIAARPLDARIALVEIQTAGPAAFAHHEATLAGVMPLLSAGREFSPVADELPATLETAVAGGVLWFLQQRLMMSEAEEIGKYLPDLVRIVIEPYLGEAGTASFLAAPQGASQPIA